MPTLFTMNADVQDFMSPDFRGAAGTQIHFDLNITPGALLKVDDLERPTMALYHRAVGYIRSDGRMYDREPVSAAPYDLEDPGTLGVRLLADDPDLNLSGPVTYRVSGFRYLDGRKVGFGPYETIAVPSTDEVVDLADFLVPPADQVANTSDALIQDAVDEYVNANLFSTYAVQVNPSDPNSLWQWQNIDGDPIGDPVPFPDIINVAAANISDSGAVGRAVVQAATAAEARAAAGAAPADAGNPTAGEPVQPRRGTAAQWTAANPVLAMGEEGYETDTTRWKRGDGATAWNSLGYTDFKISGGVVALERFTPDTDFSAALSAAITEADASGGTVVLQPGKTYTVNSTLQVIDKHVRIDFNGSRVVRDSAMANGPILQVKYTTSAAQSVVGLTTTTYDVGGGGLVTPVTSVEVASTAGWAAGDWAVIVGDDSIPGSIVANGQRDGERVYIAAVSGNYLYLSRLLRVTLTTGIRIARMTQRDCVIINPWVEDETGSPTTRNLPAIDIVQAVKPRMIGAKGQNMMCEAVRFLGCVRGVIEGSDMRNIRTSVSDGAFGYGFRLAACNDFRITGVQGDYLRHLVTTTTNDGVTAGSEDLWRFGGNIGHRIFGGHAGEVYHAAFDTHDEASFVTYDNCHVAWNHRETEGSFFGFKIRGRNNVVKDCTSYGPGGVELVALDNGGDHKLINHTHVIPAGYTNTTSSQAIRVDYSGRTSRGLAEVSGRIYATNFTGFLLQARKAQVRIPRLEITVSTSTGPTWLVEVDNSELIIDTLVVDLRGSAGEQRIFKLIDSTSIVRVKNLIVVSGGATWRIADFTTLNGVVTVSRCETDAQPSAFSAGFTNAGASATKILGDLVLNQASILTGTDTRTNSNASLDAFSKGTQILDTALTATRTITEAAAVSAMFTGREHLFIRTVNATGAFDWVIGDDALSSAGTWLRRRWTGTAWITIAKGTYNGSPTGVTVASFTGSAITTEAERITANDNDTSLPTSAAVLDLVQKLLADRYPTAYVSGAYYFCNSPNANSTSNALTADRARTTAWLVTTPTPVSAFTAEYTAAGDAGSVFRICVWNDDGYGRPSTLLVDAGTIPTDGTPGEYEVAANLTVQPGLYHVGGIIQGVVTTQPTMRIVDYRMVPHTGPVATGLAAAKVGGGYYKDGFTGAAGDITSPLKNASQSAMAPRIGFKVA